MTIIIQLFFSIELALQQLILYSILYPTRHKFIVVKRKKILLVASAGAVCAGAVSCIAGGNITFFKLKQHPLVSDAITWFTLYLVIVFAVVYLLSKVFHWTSYDGGDWFRIKYENLELYEDFSPIESLLINEEANRQIGEWKFGGETYRIIFETSTHKEDMLAHLVQKDKYTFLCDKVVLLGKPDRTETLLSGACIVARILFFISMIQINYGQLLNIQSYIENGVNVLFQSALCLISAWVLIRSHKNKTDLYGKAIKCITTVIFIISGILLVLFSIHNYLQFVL